jgi:hypothetical protein
MKLSKRTALTLIAMTGAITTLRPLYAATHAARTQASVELMQVDTAGLSVTPEFRIAIYENLLDRLAESGRFSAVLREGDRRANDNLNVLILKTKVEEFTPGSEKKRAVTTFAGATKLKVMVQLCTPGGQIVLERVVEGNVRMFGSNLRATDNLARNVAKALSETYSPAPDRSTR